MLWLLMAAAVAAQSLTAPVFLRPLDSSKLVPHGSITYSPVADLGSYSAEPSEPFTGRACIGIEDGRGEFVCLAYGDVGKDEEYTVHLNPDNSIGKLDYARSRNDTVTVHITRPRPGPQPVAKEPVQLVDGKIPEPEKEKTFIQKYWIYIVPVLLMMLVGGGGGGQ